MFSCFILMPRFAFYHPVLLYRIAISFLTATRSTMFTILSRTLSTQSVSRTAWTRMTSSLMMMAITAGEQFSPSGNPYLHTLLAGTRIMAARFGMTMKMITSMVTVLRLDEVDPLQNTFSSFANRCLFKPNATVRKSASPRSHRPRRK